jgi:hypothetical protein
MQTEIMRSEPVALMGGRLYGAFICRDGDVVPFNTEYAPLFRWEARSGTVYAYGAGQPAPVSEIASIELYWNNDGTPYPWPVMTRSLGDWLIAGSPLFQVGSLRSSFPATR